MATISMTGFARVMGEVSNKAQWTVELRSVNGRGLDIKLRIPPGLEKLDNEIRKQLSSNLARGNVSANLTLKRDRCFGRTELNEEAFKDLLAAAKRASEIADIPLADLGSLLAGKNILREIDEEDETEEETALNTAIITSFAAAIEELVKARKEEGHKLGKAIKQRLETIEDLIKQATNCPARKPEAIMENLQKSISLLTDQSAELDANRLHQEAIMLATKADIAEELDRLTAHVSQAFDLLGRSEPIGRRLDFLCQEFNREANTICSKSNAQSLTYIGLELKTIIDQMREQVQNIE